MHLTSGHKIGLVKVYDGSVADTSQNIDIVAVHGIAADPKRTWSKDGKEWLTDSNMLPSAIPTARIFRFGYESEWLGSKAIQVKISTIANQLLQALKTLYSADESTRLLLIGHCFGGIVIEKALLLSAYTSSQGVHLLDRIAGLVTLGTPHRGSGSQPIASVVARIASLARFGENSKLIACTSADSDVLSDIVDEFCVLARNYGIPMHCFFEQHKSDIAKIIRPFWMSWWSRMELVVDENSACLQGVPRQGLPSDHFQLNRYTSPENPCYIAVQDQVLRMYNEKSSKVLTKEAHNLSDRLGSEEALHAIFITDPEDDFASTSATNSRRLSNTADWIIEDSTFRTWKSTSQESVLWLNGSPGKGKTAIALALIDELRAESEATKKLGLSFFICDRDDYRRNSAMAIVRGLLYHILGKHPHAIHILRTEYDKQKESLVNSPNSVYTLWRILQNVIESLPYAEMLVVLDGLDECDASSISTLVGLIQSEKAPPNHDRSQTSSNPITCNMKWLIVSRRDDALIEQLDGSAEISLEANQRYVDLAVEDYIDFQVSLLARKKRYDHDLQKKVKETLKQKAEGTFLWVALACAQLGRPGVKAMHAARMITDLPSGLTPLYQIILDDVLKRAQELGDEDRELVVCMLRAMSVAFRPLTLFEIGATADLPDDYRQNKSTLEDFVLLCSGLVELRQEKVHFVHSSVKAFLSTTKGILSSKEDDDHFWMAKNCFYDLVTTFNESTKDTKGHEDGDLPLFLDYPAVFWNRHAYNAPVGFFKELHKHELWLDTKSPFRDAWFDYHWKATHSAWEAPASGMSALLITAYACVPAVLDHVLTRSGSARVLDSDSHGNSALMWSVKGRDARSTAILISNGANINLTNQKQESPLHWAAFNGDSIIGDLLVNEGTQLDSQDYIGWTALHRAAFGGHIRMMEKLLNAGAEIDVKDQYSWTALQRSASTGNMDVLQILAESKANTEVKDREGMTPLSTASWNGHGPVVKSLLSRGVKIEARDYEGWTALHHACWNGRDECAMILLRSGAATDARNNEEATPLFQATWNGHADIVRMLLDNGAHVNVACEGGETPLQQAAWAGHTDVVDLLVKAGADINRANDEGLTALHQASVNGQDEVVEMLLEAGADRNLQNSDGQTAYEQADENSYAATANVLLEPNSPHPSVSSSYSDHEFGVLDPEILKLVSASPAQCIMQHHGHACSSKSWKVIVSQNGHQKCYFLKTGPNINMFIGEHLSLTELNRVVPLLCPTSIAYGQMAESDDAFLLTEFINVESKKLRKKPEISLAQKLAKLHNAPPACVDERNTAMFGFLKNTFAGPVLQKNDWTESWEDFYANKRLRGVCEVISAKYPHETALFQRVERIIGEVVPRLLAQGHLGGVRGIVPSLVHGDLWSGNKTCGIINENDGPQHYIFDASSCYAHSEYELGLMRMFGGFSAGFFSEYHRLIPKTEPVGEYEDRMLLYQLYHWLVNYAITGGGFKEEALNCMETLLDKYGTMATSS